MWKMSVKSDQDYIAQLYMLELKRKNLTKWEKLKLLVYDPEKKEVFGKDGARWGKSLTE